MSSLVPWRLLYHYKNFFTRGGADLAVGEGNKEVIENVAAAARQGRGGDGTEEVDLADPLGSDFHRLLQVRDGRVLSGDRSGMEVHVSRQDSQEGYNISLRVLVYGGFPWDIMSRIWRLGPALTRMG